MSSRSKRALIAAAVATTFSSFAAAAVPSFSFGLGILESNNPAGTALGSNTTITSGSLEQINATGISVPADGQYHTVTIHIGADAVTNPGLNTANGIIDAPAAGLAALDHIRINNAGGVTAPTSIFIDDLTTDSTVITDFSTYGANTIPSGTSNVGFREPTFSSATTVLARNYTSSTDTNVQPDGTTDTNQAARVNLRFGTPEVPSVPTGTTGWVRLYAGSTSSLGPARPVIDVSNGATFSFRVAIVVNTPLYGFDDSTSGNSNWSDNANWGRGTAAASTNAPNSTSATALFDEPLPESGPAVPHTVTLDADQKVQVLQFTTSVPYTISGTSTLTVTRPDTGAQPTIDVEAGNQTIAVPVLFPDASVAAATAPTVWVSPGATLTHTNSVTVAATAGATLVKRGGGTMNVPDISFTGGGSANTLSVIGGTLHLNAAQTGTLSTVTLGNALIASGGRLEVDAAPEQTKTITTLSVTYNSSLGGQGGNALAVGTANVGVNSTLELDLAGNSALKLGALGLNVTNNAVTAKLDLTNDGVLYDYTSDASGKAVRTNIILAYNNGDWAGKGIGSSLLGANSSYGIGYRALTTGQSFMGLTAADDTTMAYRYTRLGDADLSGTVNFDDLLSLAKNYNAAYDPSTNPKLWSDGDTNYDGIVDFADLLTLAKNYNGSVAAADALAASIGGDFGSDFALAQSMVPEPATLGLLTGLSTLALRRRRQA